MPRYARNDGNGESIRNDENGERELAMTGTERALAMTESYLKDAKKLHLDPRVREGGEGRKEGDEGRKEGREGGGEEGKQEITQQNQNKSSVSCQLP